MPIYGNFVGGSGVVGRGYSVKTAGAKGDGATDDTTAFRAALASERVVFVPGGTYVLSGPLMIRANCCLELSQDTVLKFTQTSANCITMLRLASLIGNHATIFVPYTYGGKVINCDTAEDEAVLDASNLANDNATAVPPFTRWDPQWKMSRYVTDINICKPNTKGFHYSDNGTCYGTAVYMGCSEGVADYMWGVSMSGLRIAGGFVNGIHMECGGDTWNHDMRIEAVIDSCETAVFVDNTHFARLAITVQPRPAADGAKYAKHGVKIKNSRGIDLSSSRVWDWNANNTLWTNGGEYQHIALYGNCTGLILDDYLYHLQSLYDIRELIYTDTPSNLEKMTILQEPITRWFKPVDGVPYFSDGFANKKLTTQEELDSYFTTDMVQGFTDYLATATDTDGTIYGGVGYKSGFRLNTDGTVITCPDDTYTLTGFIPCSAGQKVYVEGMSLAARDGVCRFVLYDANKKYIQFVSADNVLADTYFMGGEETENGFWFAAKNVGELTNTAYVRFNVFTRMVGQKPIVAVNEEIKYTVEGFLANSIKVKAENVIGGVSVSGCGYSVKTAGAKGDGMTDDTVAFQNALAAERVVTVPGGTYVLSGTLVIRENCCLELSQDTVLKFTQTSGNCIEMRGSATLRGNHAVLVAAYGLTGNVISMDTLLDGNNHASIPPYTTADPQWKRQRFVYDVNIVKPNSEGFNRATDGKCNGTAIYMSATNVSNDSTDISFMWGITVSGVRISGGFSYGIHAINHDSADGYTDDGWNHDMRIEAVIEACEVGVALENCNGAHLSVTIQPCKSVNDTAYAKWGVYLNDSRFVDMMRSRVWDWQVARTDSEEYTHIALYGNCRGLLLDDYLVHEHQGTDIRDQIYTDTPANFDTMTILQEPANKWFKSVDNVPYFNDGTANRKLMLATDKFTAEQAEFIHPADGYYTKIPKFTNLVDGYHDGYCLDGNGGLLANAGYVATDYIPIDGGKSHTYRIGGDGVSWNDSYGYCRIAWFDADKALKGSVMQWSKLGSSIYYPAWVEDDTVAAAFSTNSNVAPPDGAAYFRLSAVGSGANLIVTIDEEQSYTSVWHGEPKRIDESIHAKNDWNAKEGEVGYVLNRTHYRETVELVNDTLGDIGDDLLGTVSNVEFVAGETYTITYNGADYVCTAFEFATEEITIAVVGNGSPLGLDDTGEPFSMYGMDGMLICLDLNGATEAKVEIAGYRYTTLPWEYLPSPVHWIDAVEVDGAYEQITVTPKQTTEAINAGLNVMLRIKSWDTNNSLAYLHYLPCVTISKNTQVNCIWNLVFSGKIGMFLQDKYVVLMPDANAGAESIEELMNLPWVVSAD